MRPGAGRRRVFLGAGALLLTAGSLYTGTTAAFLGHAERVSALVQDPGPGGRHPTLRFTLPSGRDVQIVAGGVFKPVRAGDAVEVVYDPASPAASAALDTLASLWTPAVLLFGLGGGLLALATRGS